MQGNKEKVVRLLKTARGQIDGIINMIENGQYCIDVSNQILASQAVLSKANKEILTAHLMSCVIASAKTGDIDQKMQEIGGVLDKIL